MVRFTLGKSSAVGSSGRTQSASLKSLTVGAGTAGRLERPDARPGQAAGPRRGRHSRLAEERGVLLRGEAGSGKTTLLRWLAVTAARGAFSGGSARSGAGTRRPQWPAGSRTSPTAAPAAPPPGPTYAGTAPPRPGPG
ncbi:NACHT domain-containing protein [Streptomyces luteogriseus]|uniref:NACHT domain-containing protein n=1 Tax=Streptomyces luteogriseus TaxID=68233 RepID=UPI0027D7CF43|nr:NACHT domain-containing protein [Streptomyces luteogriseus]